MNKNIHIGNRQVLLNYSQSYPKNRETLLASPAFLKFVTYFIGQQKESSPEMYDYLRQQGKYSVAESAKKVVHFLRELAVFQLDEIESPYLENIDLMLDIIEKAYHEWRSLQRFGYMTSDNAPDFGINTLVYKDSHLNDLILRTYRLFEEKLKGRPNLVYRQVQAGTNACFSVHHQEEPFAEGYEALAKIPVIDTVMLRTPMILHPKSSKRTGMFTETDVNPMTYLNMDPEEWFCFPMKVGSLLCYVYFNAKYTASALSLANLFEIATKEETTGKPDLVVIGNEDGKNATEFYHDTDNNIWVGCISDHPRIEYFGYLKKMSLTLHNLAMMEKGWLPIHGAFVNITLKDGRKKGIMLMGDSGAGKSESIEALKAAGKDKIKDIEVVFDDMGTIHLENGVPCGQGTEIGAFVRLDDLDPGTAYRDMDRSIFMGPENKNARMVSPAAPYRVVVHNHPIDLFCYANNYTDKLGMNELSVEEAKETCKMGKRMALGTTQEVGISTTYFANPFGPMQKQELCEPIIDEVFTALKENGTYLGEIYTHLGFDKENRDGINDAAAQLLSFITEE
jgi:hypothetical protein